jgi:3-oxoacyl-[acyl-carrier protein] reductase
MSNQTATHPQNGPASVAIVVLMSGNSAVFPKAPYAAVGTVNAAIVALAKAFSDRGITDGVQVNSVLRGPVMTGRRRSYLQHWASPRGASE